MTETSPGDHPHHTRVTRRRVALALTALPLGAAALVLGNSAEQRIIVENLSTGEAVLDLPVADGGTVVLAYTHSVERTPVRDVYVVDGTTLRMERMEFYSSGAGLPTEDVERTDDGYVVRPDETYDELLVSPSEVAGHELVVDGERFDLVERAAGSVVIRVAETSIVDRVRGRTVDRSATRRTRERIPAGQAR